MNTGAIDDISQASRDSEQNDELQLMDDELRQKAEAAHLAQLLRIQATVVAGRELATKTALTSTGH